MQQIGEQMKVRVIKDYRDRLKNVIYKAKDKEEFEVSADRAKELMAAGVVEPVNKKAEEVKLSKEE